MRTLIVGIGALGGLIATRLQAAGSPVWLATRNAESAARLMASGLRLTGVGENISVPAPNVASLADYLAGDKFDLIVVATKAHDAIEIAPRLSTLLTPPGTLLPIQNGGVPQILADQLGDRVLGALSNFGATMTAPGLYEQRNAGNLLIGEFTQREADRAEQVRDWLGRAVDVRITTNLRGAAWSKLLLNCSVTTLGAIAGTSMRRYIALPAGRELFNRAYDEALSVALASGARPERMIVDPLPPTWNATNRQSIPGTAYEDWLRQILNGYGDLKASMLQDFERGRTTEIDFINGYVINLGQQFDVPTPINTAIVETVHAIERQQIAPSPALLEQILQSR